MDVRDKKIKMKRRRRKIKQIYSNVVLLFISNGMKKLFTVDMFLDTAMVGRLERGRPRVENGVFLVDDWPFIHLDVSLMRIIESTLVRRHYRVIVSTNNGIAIAQPALPVYKFASRTLEFTAPIKTYAYPVDGRVIRLRGRAALLAWMMENNLELPTDELMEVAYETKPLAIEANMHVDLHVIIRENRYSLVAETTGDPYLIAVSRKGQFDTLYIVHTDCYRPDATGLELCYPIPIKCAVS
jgi:hypothetical protein